MSRLSRKVQADLERIAKCYDGSPFDEVLKMLITDFEKKGITRTLGSTVVSPDFLAGQLKAYETRQQNGIKAKIHILEIVLDQTKPKFPDSIPGTDDIAAIVDANYNGIEPD